MGRRLLAVPVLAAAAILASPSVARAIPAFARKYETSCLTCHSVYPRLTPFGEAFRRNGYRFPGVDSDYVKMAAVPLGQEANKKTFPSTGWPSSLPGGSVLAVGVNGQAVAYPESAATVSRQNHRVRFTLDDLVAEGHVWAGAALDDSITLWGELTLRGTADVEHAQVLFNDLLGPKHAVNLTVGRGFPTLGSFGPHSSYLGDQRLTNLPLTGLYGLSADPFVLVDNYNGAELTGVLGGQVDYSVGVSSGKNGLATLGTANAKVNSENVWGHLGVKVGGLRLDGEGSQGPKDALRPWAEDALTLDLFAFRSREVMGGVNTPFTADLFSDTSRTFGGALRGQLGSAELDLVFYAQRHDRAWEDPVSGAFAPVNADVSSAELSYVVFPWMVPAVRVERIGLRPTGGAMVSDLHVMPGIAFLVRANVKAVLVGNWERTSGFPVDSGGAPLPWMGGNADWGGLVAAPRDPLLPGASRTEAESIALFLAWAM